MVPNAVTNFVTAMEEIPVLISGTESVEYPSSVCDARQKKFGRGLRQFFTNCLD
jgi:hypothetical protein